jgi:hypothetical protein
VVTYDATHTRDLTIAAIAAHTLSEGEPVVCYPGADGTPRARRALDGEKATGEAGHGAGPGMPVVVVVLRRGE